MGINAALVILVGSALAATAQDPSLDTQFVAPAVGGIQASASTTPTANRVSVRFRDAKVSEVLDWLEAHKVSFVISAGDVPRDTTITLNLEDRPLESVVTAIGQALGGHWSRTGGIWIFKKGISPFGEVSGLSGDTTWGPMFVPNAKTGPFSFFTPPDQKSLNELQKSGGTFFAPPQFDGKGFDGRMIDGKSFDAKNFEKSMKDLQDKMKKSFGPDFQEKLKKLAEEAAKNRDAFPAPGAKAFEFQFKDLERMQIDAKKMAEDAARAAKEGTPFSTFKFDMAPFSGAKPPIGGKFFVPSGGVHPHIFVSAGGSLDIKGFLKNLTSEQRDKMSKRGFIWWDDLTPQQKNQLGGRPDGRFEIRYKINDDEITIKGN